MQGQNKNKETILRYYKRTNKNHFTFRCVECGRSDTFNTVYFEESTPKQKICPSCFDAMITKMKKQQAEIERAKRIEEERKYQQQVQAAIDSGKATVVPLGTTIHIGSEKRHICRSDGSKLKLGVYCIRQANGKQLLIYMHACSKCGALYSWGQDPKLFALYKIRKYASEPKQKKQRQQKEKTKPIRQKPKTVTRSVLTKPSQSQNTRSSVELKQRIQRAVQEIGPVKEIKYADFLTRLSLKKCSSAGHHLIDIKAAVRLLSPNYTVTREEIPAVYCLECNRYFIMETEYQTLSRKGTLLCNVVEENYWLSDNRDGFSLMNAESLLHKLGYNVSSNTNLPEQVRHSILKAAVDNELLTKSEILSHLSYLINRSRNRISFETAISKWEKDREYVQSLSITSKAPTYEARSITHKTPKKK